MSRTLALTLVAFCASAPALAQQAAAPAAPSRAPVSKPTVVFPQRGTTTTPTVSVQGATPAPPAARAVDPGLDPTDANITIEITVVDKAAGSSAVTTRQGTITVANQSSGSVRGLANNYSGSNTKLDPTGLDIDSRTFLRKSGMVNVSLTVAYIPAGSEAITSSVQRQSATLFLKPGQETQVLTTGSMTGAGPAVKITARAIVNK